jgi:translation initiation factor 2 alpha subunit (eIF-2alpha)
MTLSEAITVMKIMATADNWCSQCGPSLIEDFGKAFPKFEDVLLNKNDIEKLRKAYNEKITENINKDIFETNVWELN